MNTQKEYEQLKRDNRRRLIGAIVVVAIAAAILLKVLSHRAAPETAAEVTIPPAASQVQTQGTELFNPLTASEVAGASEAASAVNPPADVPQVPASEAVIPGTTEAAPPAEKPTVSEEKPKEGKPVTKPAAKPTQKPVKKLTPQEILDGKAGKNTAPAAHAKTAGTLIQAGAFVNTQQAETQRSRLANIGISAKVYRATTAKGEVYRVRIGPFTSKDEAHKVMDKLHANGFDGILVNQ